MRTKTLCIVFNWFVCGVGFYGLAQYMGQIGGNIFVNVAVSGLLELPGTFIGMYTLAKYGRRKTMIAFQILSGAWCLFIMAVPSGAGGWPAVVLSALSLLCISVVFPSCYIYSVELFPTVVRNIGVGTSSMLSRLGSMFAPFVTSFGIWSIYYPPLIFGLLPMLAAVTCFFLPETVNTILPDTIEEGERVSRKSPMTIAANGATDLENTK